MEPEQGIEHLIALGLWVRAGVQQCYTQTSAEASRGITIARSSNTEGPLQTLVEDSYVFPIGNRWVFRRWDGIGGRADDDVEFETASMADAVQCVEDYYFGKPLQLAGWLFPTNKHPEWNLGRLRDTFAKAVSVTGTEFHTIRHDRYQQFKQQVAGGPLSSFGVRFRQIEAIEPRSEGLWMRNDLMEMYLVDNDLKARPPIR